MSRRLAAANFVILVHEVGYARAMNQDHGNAPSTRAMCPLCPDLDPLLHDLGR